MRFFALHEGYYEGIQVRIDQLKAACEALNIEFIQLDSLKLNYAALPHTGRGDMLYNLSRGSSYAEFLLINDHVATFYKNKPATASDNTDTVKYSIIHDKAGIPGPKTVFHITADRHLLKQYVEYLGGFPLIIKCAGSSRGIGTIKIDSWQNLISTIDYLVNTKDRFIMREFIRSTGVGRCRVLGNEVIQMYEFPLIEGDFRTSSLPFDALKPITPKLYADDIQQICIQATHLANVEFAAVDVMIGKNGKPYVLEINFPAGLPLNWRENGNMVALKTMEYLRNKALENDR